jgi:NAD(P)-dependent dehydrogenase (short-subunit alcohol dehydrogenase family)
MKIRVNCVCPGIFPTEMTSTMGHDGEPIMGKMATKASQRCTMGRPGKAEEIAAPILLLASKGGMYMNDTCINVDGGRWLVSYSVHINSHF